MATFPPILSLRGHRYQACHAAGCVGLACGAIRNSLSVRRELAVLPGPRWLLKMSRARLFPPPQEWSRCRWLPEYCLYTQKPGPLGDYCSGNDLKEKDTWDGRWTSTEGNRNGSSSLSPRPRGVIYKMKRLWVTARRVAAKCAPSNFIFVFQTNDFTTLFTAAAFDKRVDMPPTSYWW